MKFDLSNLMKLKKLISELSVGLNRLNLLDNFEASERVVELDDGVETKVQHGASFIPQRYLIVSLSGNAVISRGTTSWDRTFAYLYNHGPDPVTVKIIFYR
jgi:hypothetical protein